MADHGTPINTKLEGRKATINESRVFKKTVDLLVPIGFTRLRCLALGSPTAEFQALYQLAFLILLVEKFDVKEVSCWDPAFSEDDKKLLGSLNFSVEEREESQSAVVARTLFYMPHAPRTFTNDFIKSIEPRWILGNDLAVTAGTLGKVKFLETLPTLATIVHMTEDQVPKRDDGFSTVSRRKKKNQKFVYKEPELEYPVKDMYFDQVQITRINGDSSQPWKDLFSDMALNIFRLKEVESALEELSIST